VLERIANAHGRLGAAAALLGVGGFLPLADAYAQLCAVSVPVARELGPQFDELSVLYAFAPLDSAIWTLNRSRPANHPMRRLASLADLLARAQPEGLLVRTLAADIAKSDPFGGWLEAVEPGFGADRRTVLVTNVFAPFLAAYADATEDEGLSERVGQFWERVPSRVSDATARRTLRQIAGEQRLPIRLALEEQGLHQIGRFGCAPLRCFECPIAELAARYEDWS
jgi:hypothetical protein